MKTIRTLLLIFVVFYLAPYNTLQAQNWEAQFDPILTAEYKANGPGVTALVFKNGDIIYRKAFGMSNLELKVPMIPENIFELGSITKQFTAVCILMLAEEGKLSLDDEITKYIPDYPTHGKKITIHHLLNHTSGIKSYTEMDNLMELGRLDKTPIELIDYFKNEPMDFDPGEEWHYNNSGYVILGHIIEEISGQSYEDFVGATIFEPLGMKHSYYGSKTRLIKNRASGYMPSEQGYRNADYLSMTLPYAAGSLMSCVDDMLLWHKAVHGNTLISAESTKRAFTNTTLNNGEPTNYGYGWQIQDLNGTPCIEHGGGIFGYVTHGVYVPSENVYVILLTNVNGISPQDEAVKMAALAIGKPYPNVDESVIELTENQLNKWVGNYQFEKDILRSIFYEDGALFSQREGSGALKLFPISEDEFLFEGGLSSYLFELENGKKTARLIDRGEKTTGMETDKKSATQKEAITITPELLTDYEGTYELQPGFNIQVTTQEGKIFAQATGQPQFEIFPEAEDTFFLKVVAAQLVFSRDSSGAVNSVTLKQGGQEMKGKRLE